MLLFAGLLSCLHGGVGGLRVSHAMAVKDFDDIKAREDPNPTPPQTSSIQVEYEPLGADEQPSAELSQSEAEPTLLDTVGQEIRPVSPPAPWITEFEEKPPFGGDKQ